MKKIFLNSLLILSILTNVNFAQTAKPAQAAATTPAKTKQSVEVPFFNKVLPNGLEVIVLPDASVPLVTVELAVRNVVHGQPIKNREALANPEALAYFDNRPELKT